MEWFLRQKEVATFPHGDAQFAISEALYSRFRPHVKLTLEAHIILQRQPYKTLCPDIILRAKYRTHPPPGQGYSLNNDTYPTLVIEIAKSQSVPDLSGMAAMYFHPDTTIRMYIYIKIYELRPTGGQAMLAASITRSSPTPLVPSLLISFGTTELALTTLGVVGEAMVHNLFRGVGFGDPPCTAADLAAYQLNLPTAEIFHDVQTGISNNMPGSIDLFEVKDYILSPI